MENNVLIYLGDELQKEEVLKTVLNEMNLTYRFLQDEDLQELVGYLIGLDTYEKKAIQGNVHFASDLMIFHQVCDEQIQELNERLSKYNVTMKRKAMLTQHNANWLLKDLMTEIEEEHHYFQIMEEIHSILKASSELEIASFTPMSWSIYEKAFYDAYECIQKQNTIDVLEARLQTLKSAKQNLKKRN